MWTKRLKYFSSILHHYTLFCYIFLEVGARVSKPKRRSATKNFELFLINLASLYPAQLHIFWKQVHAFHWKLPPKCILEVKRLWKFRCLGGFSKANTEECDKKIWNGFDQFGILTLFSYIFSGSRCTHFIKKTPPKGLYYK